MEAIVYIGHGSRSPKGNELFIQMIEKAMERVEAPIQEIGFLELVTPTIPEAIETAIQKGATTVTVIPVLLLAGVHSNQDIPERIREVKQKHPDITFHYGKPLGPDVLLADILQNRLQEQGYRAGDDTAVLLTGHGSRDPEAPAAFRELTKLLQLPNVHPCFLKMSEPSFEGELKRLSSDGFREIYVLPYLLFTGAFTGMMQDEVDNVMGRNSDTRVILCKALGFPEELVQLLVKRVGEAKALQEEIR